MVLQRLILIICLLPFFLLFSCKEKIEFDKPFTPDNPILVVPKGNNPLIVSSSNIPIDSNGSLFIVKEETGGEAYYNLKLKYPTVPPGSSGITIGVGVDLRFYSPNLIKEMWYKLGEKNTDRLSKASGLTHTQSIDYLPKVKDILVTWGLANEVYYQNTLPDYYNKALNTYPGLEKLHVNAISAITSLILNRGESLIGKNREEMKNIKPLVIKKDYQGIADEIRKMKRIWANRGMDGLIKRREREAQLVESAIVR